MEDDSTTRVKISYKRVKKEITSFSLYPDTKARLKQLAREEGLSMSAWLDEMIMNRPAA
jgi:predicted DNA-binding protein